MSGTRITQAGRRFVAGTAALLACLAAAAGTAQAATDTITAQPGRTYSGGTGPGGSFAMDAGIQPPFVNADSGSDGSHNVVATADGPDGRPLFSTPLLGSGGSAPLSGAQYLAPGSYPFVCTIHAGMAGTLTVSGPGTAARPAISVSVVTNSLSKLQAGRLKLRVAATTESKDVTVSARFKGSLGFATDIDLSAGESRKVTLHLNRAQGRRFEGLSRAKVLVSGSVPFGSAVSASRMLR